jgi:hypothetical protein
MPEQRILVEESKTGLPMQGKWVPQQMTLKELMLLVVQKTFSLQLQY